MDAVWTDALVIVGVAALPVCELRCAIPLALSPLYAMAPFAAYGLGVLGNLLPVVLVLLLLEGVVAWLRRFALFERGFDWLFARTRRRFSPLLTRLGEVALILVVAVPLPMTGAWTGSLIAFLFGIPLGRALPLIGLGVMIAGAIVTLSTLGILRLF